MTMSLLPIMTFKAVEWYFGRYATHDATDPDKQTEQTNDCVTAIRDEGKVRYVNDAVSDGLEMQELEKHDDVDVICVEEVSQNPLSFR